MAYNFPKDLLPRKILAKLIPFLAEKEILLLYGMRQTGKTSLLYLLGNYLVEKMRINPKQIVYFDLENISSFEKLESLNNYDDFLSVLKKDFQVNTKGKAYVLIDEIQHLSNPASFLKYLYDHYGGLVKFIITGSSSLEIKKKFTDALTGRVYRFEVLPLSFEEFCVFAKTESSFSSFEQFILYGGFPAVALKKELSVAVKLLGEIYSLYIKRDIKDLGAIEDVLSFNKLVTVLASQTGGLVSENNLAGSVGIARATIKNYLFLLENTFVITLLPPFFTNPKKEITKRPKVYLIDNGIRNAIIDNFSSLGKRSDSGQLAENAIFSELKKETGERIRFWRSEKKQEVDFVLEKEGLIPLEVKYQIFKKPQIPESLAFFLKKYQTEKAFVLTKDFRQDIFLGKTKVFFRPCWKIQEVFSLLP